MTQDRHHLNLLTLDDFSNGSNGRPIGDERFVILDTEGGSRDYADEV